MKKNTVRITTPIGVAQWPRLNEPDTKFDKEGVYSVGLRVPKDDSIELINVIKACVEDHTQYLAKEDGVKNPKEAPLPFKDATDSEGSPTGEIEFKFKLKAIGKNKGDSWEQRPMLYDSAGTPTTASIGGGSKIQIGAEVVPYYTAMAGVGATLRLKAVRVVELVEYSKGGSFDSWSFSQEKGFVANNEESEAEHASDNFDF